MKRTYTDGTDTDSANFFVGTEVERTPAYGLRTLFVTGVQPVDKVATYRAAHSCEHIFFGANHSFEPGLNMPEDAPEWEAWENMIKHFLEQDVLCTLDIPVKCTEEFLESGLNEYNGFIPQIRIPMPYVQQWNYNTMLKIDDKDFNATNPGVWCHNLHDLMNRQVFTDWQEYRGDDLIE